MFLWWQSEQVFKEEKTLPEQVENSKLWGFTMYQVKGLNIVPWEVHQKVEVNGVVLCLRNLFWYLIMGRITDHNDDWDDYEHDIDDAKEESSLDEDDKDNSDEHDLELDSASGAWSQLHRGCLPIMIGVSYFCDQCGCLIVRCLYEEGKYDNWSKCLNKFWITCGWIWT